LNAARLATRLIRDAGLTWPQVLAPDAVVKEAVRQLLIENDELRAQIGRLKSAGIRPRSPAPWRAASSLQEAVENLVLWEDHLSRWELKFLDPLARRSQRYAPRQTEVLRNIGEKGDRCIRSSWARAS
jgi:hypothetical protein